MTDRESKVLELAIEWSDAKYAVAKALLEAELNREIRMLKKERRDAKVKPESEEGAF